MAGTAGTDSLLAYQRLSDRLRTLTDELEHTRTRLAGDPEVEAAADLAAQAQGVTDAIAARLREAEIDSATRLETMRGHERELMSGRIRSPNDLTRMSVEVEHMKAAVRVAEDAQLEVMDELDRAEAALSAAVSALEVLRERADAARPELERHAAELMAEIETLESERERAWALVPPTLQGEYRRVARLANPVVEISGGQCAGCHVQLTANELQQLRRGERHSCQNCSRILVF